MVHSHAADTDAWPAPNHAQHRRHRRNLDAPVSPPHDALDLVAAPGYLTERLGAVRLFFSLEANHAVLRMRLEGLRFLGIPCPAWLRPAVLAEESGDGDRFRFNVRASVPLLGVVAAYRGYLDLSTMERE